jgi:hypothetical protein
VRRINNQRVTHSPVEEPIAKKIENRAHARPAAAKTGSWLEESWSLQQGES